MKKNATTILIWLFFLAPILMPILILLCTEFSYIFTDMQINPLDYARITDVEYVAIVVDEPDSRGKAVITERLTFDIHAASKNNLFWELWRDLPEDDIDGAKVRYKVNYVKQIMDDGTEVYYEQSPKLYWEDSDYLSSSRLYGPGKWYHSKGPYSESEERYECVFFYVDGLYREEVVFEIQYEMYNAALKYNDCSDLYLSMYSESTINHLESYKAEILFPDKDMPSEGNYKVYTYGTNANDFPVKEYEDKYPGYHTFSISLDEEDLKFKPYNEYIEFDLVSYGEDKHIFTDYAPSNYYTNDDVLVEIYDEQHDYATAPARFRVIKVVVLLVSLAVSGIFLIYALKAKSRVKAKHMFYEPTTQMDFYREIPSDLDPNFAAALVYCKQKPPKDDSGVYSAILLSLARKEYIELRETSNDVEIILKKKPTPAQRVTASQESFSLFKSTEPLGDLSVINQTQVEQPSVIYDPQIGQITIIDNTTPVAQAPVTEISTVEIPVEGIPTAEIPSEPVKEYEPLTTCEGYYYNLLVRHTGNSGIITMSAFQRRVSNDYSNTDAFATNMENSIVNIGVKEGYFQKADYKQPMNQMLSTAKSFRNWGIIFLTIVNIISYRTRLDLAFGAFFILGISFLVCSYILKKQAPNYVLLTQFGEDEYAKWRGLYNFLNSETLIHERSFIELPLWEKYLVYATAFGLPEKVISSIALNCPEATESVILNNSYCCSARIHHSSRSFRSSVRSGSSFARSGGGGGFGYGGGGRGGGGGGGGH